LSLCYLLLSLVLISPAVFAASVTQIHDVRLWRSPDKTRLVFDLTQPVKHKIFTLDNPRRIVIDVADAKAGKGLVLIGEEDAPVQKVRHGPRENGGLRIVLDMRRKVKINSFVLEKNEQYGDRLVVDLFDLGADIKTEIEPEISSAVKTDTTKTDTKSEPRAETKTATEIAVVTKMEPIMSPSTPTSTAVPSHSVPALSAPSPSVEPVIAKKSIGSQYRNIVIAIDAGHGGEDPGAVSKGAREKDVVLAISRELKVLFDRRSGYTAVLVRKGDYYIPLKQRPQIARKNKADLFISVHADAFANPSAQGASVFAVSERGATSEAARFLAQKENRADLIGGEGGVSLSDKDDVLAGVLMDLSVTASLSTSIEVAGNVLKSMSGISKLHSPRVEQAGFVVLKSPDMPSILVETGFISNPQEASRLKTQSYQLKMATSIYDAVIRHFENNPPPGTSVASQKKTEMVKN